MSKSESPLVDAATSFDAELAVYARLGELFLKTPVDSLKQLERANQTLGELADCEQRLQDTGKRLIEALTAARGKQEQLSADVVAHAPSVQARNVRLRELMTAMGELATDVAAVNAEVLSRNGDAGAAADAAAISSQVLGLSDRAESLAKAAREASFAELAEQAHSLHQRLKAIATKLQKA